MAEYIFNTSPERSNLMRKIKSVNTKPEKILRNFLWSKGLRYRINYKKLPGTPDIVFTKYQTVIFIHGCFWHGHENCKIAHIPKTNTNYWENKISRNKERDKNTTMQLLALGWKVITIWECEIYAENMENIFFKIKDVLIENTISAFHVVKVYEQVAENIQEVAEDIIPYIPIKPKDYHKEE